MVRRIIRIDEEKCNGCGACAAACHEGAIAMVEGKARLLRDDYCDGLGDCLPACPTGAITFVEREAAAYDEQAVLAHKQAKEAHTGCPGHQMHRFDRPASPAPCAVPQAMPSQQFEDDGDPADESNSALLVKFFDSFAVAPRDTDEGNRYGWLDEVESEEVSRALRSLSSQQIEILTLVAFEGYSATEAGRLLGMTQQGVSWHISKMKKILKNLKNNL